MLMHILKVKFFQNVGLDGALCIHTKKVKFYYLHLEQWMMLALFNLQLIKKYLVMVAVKAVTEGAYG